MKKINFKIPFFTAAILLLVILGFYFTAGSTAGNNTNSKFENTSGTAKYIFYFIGDGMAMPHVQMTEAALPYIRANRENTQQLNIRQFDYTGLSTTHAETRYITGSAAAGTALATGHKTSIGTIAKTGDHSQNLTSIAKIAKKENMRIGIISSVSIDHATPAVFYANADSRSHYNFIASQMASSDFDYFGGGYAAGNFKKNKTPDRNPETHQAVDIEKLMTDNGYKVSKNAYEFQNLEAGKNWVFSAYNESDGSLSYEIDRKTNELSLAQYTEKAIELLKNDKGFFIMVEGGKIDWASHANDATTVAGEVLAFDNAIGKALEFYEKHPDETLIVITSDHETGGLGLGFSGTKYESDYRLLSGQKISAANFSEKADVWIENRIAFNKVMDSVSFYFGLNDTSIYSSAKLSPEDYSRIEAAYTKSISGLDESMSDYIIYGSYNPFTTIVTRILNEKAGIAWTTYSHTAGPVPVFAKGSGERLFTGYYDNTDIPKKILKAAKLVKE
jgi:alkaline phosphatase